MRRADRLFEIIQVFRRARGPLTADAIAAELETSKRTIYRDIAALIGQRVPIRGEAGIGYVLEQGFDLPPLMLTSDEIEAVVLGAQWVAAHADPALAKAAAAVLAKVTAVVPEGLRAVIEDPAVGTPAGLARARRRGDRRREAARLVPAGPQAFDALCRRRRTRQRPHGLAVPRRLSRLDAGAAGLVRAAPGFSHVPHRSAAGQSIFWRSATQNAGRRCGGAGSRRRRRGERNQYPFNKSIKLPSSAWQCRLIIASIEARWGEKRPKHSQIEWRIECLCL